MRPCAYYNENDQFTAAWLRELIAAGLITPGDVDERSIADVRPSDLDGYTQCHFFAGIGGWSLALRYALWPDDRPVWTGSCPCQPFSAAGKRKGFADERHLWPVWRELIRERRPAVVFGEQVAAAADWLRLVRGDLEAMGRAVAAIPVEAASAGADHLRDRFWFVATMGVGLADAHDARPQGWQRERQCADQRPAWSDGVADSDLARQGEGRQQRSGQLGGAGGDQETRDGALSDSASEQVGAAGQPREHVGMAWVVGADGKARRVKPGIRLLAHGFPGRVGLLRGFGNAVDPRPAAAFIKAYSEAVKQ